MSGTPDMRPPRRCKHGHERTPENTYVKPNGEKLCRVCRREQARVLRRRVPKTRHPVRCVDCGAVRLVLKPEASSQRCSRCSQIHARGGLVNHRPCDHCGRDFRKAGPRRRYCSVRCRQEAGGYSALGRRLHEERQGNGNPNFKHGKRIGLNIRGWSVKDKGESWCRVCGATEGLHLHHMIPRSIAPREARYDLRNGMALCNSCHMKWHQKSLLIPRERLRPEELAYLSGLTLTGREIGAWLDHFYPVRVTVCGQSGKLQRIVDGCCEGCGERATARPFACVVDESGGAA